MSNIIHQNQFTEKLISIIGGKLFSFYYKTVFELAQSLQDFKTSDLNWFPGCEALAQNEALTLCQDKVFASFLCVLSLSSVLERFIHLCYYTGSLGRSTPTWETKAPLLFSCIPNIFSVKIVPKTGEKFAVLQLLIDCF